MSAPTHPCPWCGVPPKTPSVAHKVNCRIYRKWAGLAPKVDRNATLTGRDRLSVEGLADRLRDW